MSVEIPAIAVPSTFKGSVDEKGPFPEKSAAVMVMLCCPAVNPEVAPPVLDTASYEKPEIILLTLPPLTSVALSNATPSMTGVSLRSF